jgi:ribonuclease R
VQRRLLSRAQDAIDGNPDDKTQPLLEQVLKPLWAAYRTVSKARDQRAPLDLDLP